MKEREFKMGQVLTFDVYGTTVVGEFIETCEEKDGCVRVKITHDSTGVSLPGETDEINIDFLVK